MAVAVASNTSQSPNADAGRGAADGGGGFEGEVGYDARDKRAKERQLLERLASSAAEERSKGFDTNVDPRDVSWRFANVYTRIYLFVKMVNALSL